jgi:DNA-binding HxlR family transcriptional regulator
MLNSASYGQFCPVSMAAEIFCARWTALVLRELLCGTTRFNDLRRGVPRMSPSLLSKRLKELESAGVIRATHNKKGVTDYLLTRAGEDLRPLVMGLGIWGQHWVETKLSLKNLDPSLLMWDMRRSLNPKPLPRRQCCIQFSYVDVSAKQQNWWLLVSAAGEVDLCNSDPGHEIDLLVNGSLRAMTSVWMGISTIKAEAASGSLDISGEPAIAAAMQEWLGLSPFASEKSLLAG